MEAGAELGIGHAGTRVINTLRIEKGEEEESVNWCQLAAVTVLCAGFRAWGREMNKDVSPIEAGLMPFVRMKKKVHTIYIHVDTCIATYTVTYTATCIATSVVWCIVVIS